MLNIVLRGSPYEIGFQHGRALKPLVDGIVSYLVRSDVDNSKVQETIERLNVIAPELVLEMRGIADGADQPFEQIVKLNIKKTSYNKGTLIYDILFYSGLFILSFFMF